MQMTITTISRPPPRGSNSPSACCLLLATGASEANVIAKAVEDPITRMTSATALQLHARSTVIVDEEAAGNLAEKDYYRWIFTNEPEWEEYR